MSKKTKIAKQTKVIDVSKLEEEKYSILANADKIKGEQLLINPIGKLESKKELEQFAFNNTENPEKKYEIYYNGISKLLRKYLPKGKEHKKARSYIYEEKNVYLTRGKRINNLGIRGGDGRMSYINDADDILKIIMDWIFRNGSMIELFNTLREKNIKKGYGVRKF